MFVKLLREIMGYAQFTVIGKFPERFLNLNSRSGIFLWNVIRTPEGISACVRAREYKYLRRTAKKAGVRLSVTKKSGTPFICHRYRHRWGMPVGAVLFVVILYVLSLFVWAVDIENSASNIDSDLMRARLSAYGVRPGVMRSSILCDEVEEKIMYENSAVAWMSINTGSSRIVVNVKGRTYAPLLEEDDTPCNLIASKAGQIVAMDITEGQVAAKRDQAVAEGDLLVSGIIDTYTGTRTVQSKGTVSARTETIITATTPFKRTEKVKNGEQVRLRSIDIFGNEIPLFFKKPAGEYETYYSERPLTLFGYTLDIKVKNLLMIGLTDKEIILSREEAEQEALLQADEIQRVTFRGAKVESAEDKVIAEENSITIERTIICVENIAVRENINIKN